MERALILRDRLLSADEVSFLTTVTADYGDHCYTFSMKCWEDDEGNLAFTVIQPESISEITGTLSAKGGALTFDQTALYFDMLTDEQLSPVSAPWILLNTLRSGYLRSVSQEESGLRITLDDTYEDGALMVDVWTDPMDLPVRGDILYDGRRILSVSVEQPVIE